MAKCYFNSVVKNKQTKEDSKFTELCAALIKEQRWTSEGVQISHSGKLSHTNDRKHLSYLVSDQYKGPEFVVCCFQKSKASTVVVFLLNHHVAILKFKMGLCKYL